MRSSWKIRTWRVAAWAAPGSARSSMIRAGARRRTAGVIPISDRPLYTSFAWAYDLVAPSGSAPQPDEAARLLAGRRTIVDAGCGTGRHSAFLASAGFSVVGIDSSAAMIDVARARGSEAVFGGAGLLAWRPPSPADGVLCRGVLNDFIKDEDRQVALDSVAAMLRDG